MTSESSPIYAMHYCAKRESDKRYTGCLTESPYTLHYMTGSTSTHHSLVGPQWVCKDSVCEYTDEARTQLSIDDAYFCASKASVSKYSQCTKDTGFINGTLDNGTSMHVIRGAAWSCTPEGVCTKHLEPQDYSSLLGAVRVQELHLPKEAGDHHLNLHASDPHTMDQCAAHCHTGGLGSSRAVVTVDSNETDVCYCLPNDGEADVAQLITQSASSKGDTAQGAFHVYYWAPTETSAPPPAASTSNLSESCQAIINLAQKDSDGFISPSEFEKLIRIKKTDITSDEVQMTVRMADADGDGKLSPDEVCYMLELADRDPTPEEACTLFIRAADFDKDGAVTKYELTRAAFMFGETISNGINAKFAMYDSDNDGKLSKIEMCNMLSGFATPESTPVELVPPLERGAVISGASINVSANNTSSNTNVTNVNVNSDET